PTDSAGDGGPASAAHLNGPRGIAADPAGNIYVAEEGGARIRRIDKDGIITTIAGNGQPNPDGHNPRVAGDPGPAPAMEAQFNTIHDLNLDKDGNLWIADSKNNRVRVVFDPAHAPAGTPAGPGAQSPPPPNQQQNPPPQQQDPPPQQQNPPPQQSPQNPPPGSQDPQSPQGKGSPATTTTAAPASTTTTTTAKGATTTTTAPATTTTTAAKGGSATTTTTAAKAASPESTTSTTAAAAEPPKKS
ncbi:MAG TPA: hypothetical protein VKO35_13245, partial [Acidimicrobiia bacterium]|nr:hypothetical protein [Acidimicrobiia bacterium]